MWGDGREREREATGTCEVLVCVSRRQLPAHDSALSGLVFTPPPRQYRREASDSFNCTARDADCRRTRRRLGSRPQWSRCRECSSDAAAVGVLLFGGRAKLRVTGRRCVFAWVGDVRRRVEVEGARYSI